MLDKNIYYVVLRLQVAAYVINMLLDSDRFLHFRPLFLQLSFRTSESSMIRGLKVKVRIFRVLNVFLEDLF